MAIHSVTPEQAQELIRTGVTYVDVRSEAEFVQGHPPGAVNVPVAIPGPSGMVPNPDFVSVMNAAFEKTQQLIIGCMAGGRSRRAAEMLEKAGYTQLSDMTAGWAGSRDAFGRPLPGWSQRGLPVESGLPESSSYSAIKARGEKK